MAKEKQYTVRLNHSVFSAPTKNGNKVGGVIYRRGGFQFEANTMFTVGESELHNFEIAVPRQFKGKEVKPVRDKFLLIEEVKQPRGEL